MEHYDGDQEPNHQVQQQHYHEKPSESRHYQEKPSERIKEQRKRTNVIALGILFLVSLGLLGFEVASNKRGSSNDQLARESKSLLILSKDREQEGAGLIHSLTSNRNDPEHSRIDVLQETNRVQSNKIKALKKQLVEASQKLHEIKAHLFTKGDPSDRARLADICQDLVEKERINHEHKEKIAQLEGERVINAEKIHRMENTIDALAAMTDTQRTAKESAIANFQKQIQEIQASAKKEKDEFLGTIEELEEAQHCLKDSLEEKAIAIKKLEEEVSWQYETLEEKEKEMHAQAALYTSSERSLHKQLQDLIVAMEFEVLSNRHLHSELEVVQARQNAQYQYSKDLEEKLAQMEGRSRSDRQQFTGAVEALVVQYLELQGLIDVYTHAHQHFTDKQIKLNALFNDEKKRADSLYRELQEALTTSEGEQQRGLCLEEELHKAAQEVALLKDELHQKQSYFEAKSQEFEALTYSQTSLRDQLEEKIHQLTASLEEEKNKVHDNHRVIRDLTFNIELEKTRSQELDHYLKNVLAENKAEKSRVKNLENDLTSKAEVLSFLEKRLQDKQKELEEHKKELGTLGTHLEQEQMRCQEFYQALVVALEENKSDQFIIKTLEDTVEEDTATLAMLHDRLAEKNDRVEALETEVSTLSSDLEKAKRDKDAIQWELAMTAVERDAEKQRAENLQQDTKNKSKSVLSLQNALANKEQEVRSLSEQLTVLTEELNGESSQVHELKKELQSTLAQQKEEEKRLQSLQGSLNHNEKQILALLEELDQTTVSYEAEQRRAKDLEESLLSALARNDKQSTFIAELEQTILEHNHTIASLKDVHSKQKEELSILQQEGAVFQRHINTEKNRAHVLQQAHAGQVLEAIKLEKRLQEAMDTISEKEEAIVNQENVINEMQDRMLALSQDLEQEMKKTLDLHYKLESELTHSERFRTRSIELEKQLEVLLKDLQEKEHTLHLAEETRQEKELAFEQLKKLKQEKGQLEQKYMDQLDLLRKQQETVDRLSQDLLSKENKEKAGDTSQELSQASLVNTQ